VDREPEFSADKPFAIAVGIAADVEFIDYSDIINHIDCKELAATAVLRLEYGIIFGFSI